MEAPGCRHRWEMANIEFGFAAFEKCYHCDGLRTFFAPETLPFLGDKYREGDHYWSRVENAQSFRFDLRCSSCDEVVSFKDLMGLLYCTGCMPECHIEVERKKLEVERTFIVLACGFVDEKKARPNQISSSKLEILSDYFNQRRDTSRSKIAVLPFDLKEDLRKCQAEFLHDVGMLSQEPPEARKSPF